MKKNNPSHTAIWRFSVAGALFLTVWLLPAILTGCSRCESDSDEQQIRKLVSDAAERAEQHNINGLFDLATKTFVANPGALDRRSCKAMLMMMFRRLGSFKIAHPMYAVNLSNDKTSASVSIPFLLIREGQQTPNFKDLMQDPARWMEEARKIANPYLIDIALIKENDWRVTSVHITGRLPS